MILYLDASAAVKQYVEEPGTAETHRAVEQATVTGTVVISFAEICAALARAARVGTLSEAEAQAARERFYADWPSYARVQVTEELVVQAGDLAWQHGLRGYDAVHLAAASVWRTRMAAAVTFATFDRALWKAAQFEGFEVLPPDLPELLAAWRQAGG
ncbi:MAG TPA: type II toxin-antitoxin system VapC family toxin [Thermoflexia bacterium]|nr:type II toxin-antitoxin system VapC family toxin [Thermoflexia bacterium]